MNIALPDAMKDRLDTQLRRRGVMSASEFIRGQIRQQRVVTALRQNLDATKAVPAPAGDTHPASGGKSLITGAILAVDGCLTVG